MTSGNICTEKVFLLCELLSVFQVQNIFPDLSHKCGNCIDCWKSDPCQLQLYEAPYQQSIPPHHNHQYHHNQWLQRCHKMLTPGQVLRTQQDQLEALEVQHFLCHH